MTAAPVRSLRIGRVDCMVTGSGPPLVLLPGLTPENRCPVGPIRAAEIQAMNRYSDRFTVHWVGRPVGLAPGTTFARMTGCIADALREQFDEPVDVLGLSTGGSFAQQLAADHPGLVRRLVLVSTGCRLGAEGARTQRTMLRVIQRAGRRAALAYFAWDLVPRWRGRTVAAATLFAFGPRLYPGAGDLSDMRATLAAEDTFDLRALAPIGAPTLIVNGGRDRFYERAIMDETARLIPNSRLVVYPDRGHVTVVSDKRAIRAVRDFLIAPDVPRLDG
jgi:pimeloyl-ACP methyl ester carboxylesterase